VLVLIVFASILIPRPFCRYLCPLGAFYSFFNRVSFYGITLEESRCTSCGRCAQVCPMGVNVRESPNSTECIRCGQCSAACPTGAICQGFSRSLETQADERA